MTLDERRNLVLKWEEATARLDGSWTAWRDLGVQVEAPFPEAAWRMHEAYTSAVEALAGLKGDGWLSWFHYERPQGSAAVRVEEREYQIRTLDDLLDFFDAEYPCSEGDD